MGNCGSSLDCNAEKYSINSTEPLEVDPDIAGPGVLASFIISGALAISVIFAGYFTDSLPRRHLHKIDRVFIRQCRDSYANVHRKLENFFMAIPGMRVFWDKVQCAAKRSGLMKLKLANVPREIRVEALLRFLLVNSDQQLVTGLAVLVGGLAQRCKISGYEFQIVASLGWFSTTTHLATLTVLTNYFRDHPEVLGMRLLGMLVTLGLLSFSIVVSLLKKSPVRAPIQCGMKDIASSGGEIAVVFVLLLYIIGAFISRIANLAVDARKSKESYLKVQANLNALAQQKSNSSSEKTKSILPYPDEKIEVSHHDQHEESGFINSYAKGILWMRAHIFLDLPCGEEFKRILPVALKNAEDQRDAHFDSATSANEKKRSWVFYADLLSVDYCNSFAFGFSILLFAFAFGIAQVVQSRQTQGQLRLSGEAKSWGFGQIVPLFLLALPLLAAAEIYFESRRKAHSHFYALAIADGDADEEEKDTADDDEAGGDLPGLERQDTFTPNSYRTFVDTRHVRYSLRLAVFLNVALLVAAGVLMESSFSGVGYAATIIVGLVVLFAVYATFREVFLVGKGMKEVLAEEARSGKRAETADASGKGEVRERTGEDGVDEREEKVGRKVQIGSVTYTTSSSPGS